MRPLWISRPLLNWKDVYQYGVDAGIRKMIPHDQLHLTLATMRDPVDWDLVEPEKSEIHLQAEERPIQIFAWTIKALVVTDEALIKRHAQLLSAYPEMDHPDFRPHISLYKGGRMPKIAYNGPIVLGPERLIEFDHDNSRGIKHVKVKDALE